jgi:hypothetical protein
VSLCVFSAPLNLVKQGLDDLKAKTDVTKKEIWHRKDVQEALSA